MILRYADRLNQMPITLASGSPRRQELLRQIGLAFNVVESGFKENLEKDDAREYCTKTALEKAECVSRRLGPLRSLIVAADTVVQIGTQFLEKPSDEIDARRMLKELSGKDHWVHTGMAIITPSGHKHTFVATTRVTFSAIPDKEVDAYIQTGEWRGKAGAYGVQGAG